ncbi:helix-turn-helix domain-containing protein [Streptomyces sp. NPDC048254]|uniref:helix-turn-helix domain-containing protein n=1 Tax=Streptomyces sp. NPDC048254 TaxID=3365525 RepID=UPI00371078EF
MAARRDGDRGDDQRPLEQLRVLPHRPPVRAGHHDSSSAGQAPRSAGGTGRKKLAEDAGMSPWSVGRMLKGETLPLAENVYATASVLGVDENQLLDTGGYRDKKEHPKKPQKAVLSVANPLTRKRSRTALGSLIRLSARC